MRPCSAGARPRAAPAAAAGAEGLPASAPAPSDEELLAQTKSWTIVGKDLIKEVTCKEPYEWADPTGEEWEFAEQGEAPARRTRPAYSLPAS